MQAIRDRPLKKPLHPRAKCPAKTSEVEQGISGFDPELPRIEPEIPAFLKQKFAFVQNLRIPAVVITGQVDLTYSGFHWPADMNPNL